MIRPATHDDIPALIDMGREFHAMSPHKPMGEYDGEAVGNMLEFLISSPSAIVLTNGAGAIGGVMAPIYFCPVKWMLEESFWWSRSSGFELLQEFLNGAREMGATCVYLSTLENKRSPAIHRILTRIGFRLVEHRYVKDL